MSIPTVPRPRPRQAGQMLVIFAGALILIMAISALVVDLGFVFMLRRQEQNAADPGAVAAARYIPPRTRASCGAPPAATRSTTASDRDGLTRTQIVRAARASTDRL